MTWSQNRFVYSAIFQEPTQQLHLLTILHLRLLADPQENPSSASPDCFFQPLSFSLLRKQHRRSWELVISCVIQISFIPSLQQRGQFILDAAWVRRTHSFGRKSDHRGMYIMNENLAQSLRCSQRVRHNCVLAASGVHVGLSYHIVVAWRVHASFLLHKFS